jgi:hypothetical protein
MARRPAAATNPETHYHSSGKIVALTTTPRGNTSQDLRRRVITHLDPGPANQGHQGPDDQQCRSKDKQQHGRRTRGDRNVS